MRFALFSAAVFCFALLAPRAIAQGVPPAPPADTTYESNEVIPTVPGIDEIDVDVKRTNATTWRVLCWNSTTSKWDEVQTNGAGFQPSGNFTITLNNALDVNTRYKVVGDTVGTVGPYDAEATI